MRVVEKDNKINLVVIVGNSGSGKSSVVNNLVNNYSGIFHKLPQVTTRPPRENKDLDSYIHLGKVGYDSIKSSLIGKLENFYGNDYGTIKDFKYGYINLVILAKDALDELKLMQVNDDIDINIFTIGIDKSVDDSVKREGRSEEEVNNERIVLEDADHIFKASSTSFVTSNDVISLLKENGLIVD